MSNVVFDRALAAHRETFAAVETEIQRLAGIHAQIEVLEANRRELLRINAELAEKIAAGRRTIEEARRTAAWINDNFGDGPEVRKGMAA